MQLRQFVCLVFLTSLRYLRGQVPGCRPDQFQCADGTCIPVAWRCDRDGDCLDGSDEMDCAASPVPSSPCPPGQFACMGSPGCIGEAARCDGQRQCASGSDEVNCTAVTGCLDSDWTCQNRICIPKELRCNGANDCLDNSDETGCGRCDQDSFRCPGGGMCLSAEERCDGKIHCSDGSDEPNTCGRRCSVSNGGCSHVCVDEPWGALCGCPDGYKLAANGAVCEDVDECSLPLAPCQHYCVNTAGSYFCHCREGFTQKGNTTCLATGNSTRFLTVSKRSIGLWSLKSQQFEVIQSPGTDPVALAFDLARGLYYWADDQGSIYRTDGQHSRMLFTGEPGIQSLACDWLNDQLYWTNQKTASIYVASANGGGYTTLLRKDIGPLELVLLPMESSMFWINASPGDRMSLEKAWMDGSKRSSLVVLTAQNPHSLTVDVAARRLYWISDFKKSIETVKLDGSGRYTFSGLSSRRRALGLAVFETWFYWTDEAGLWRAPQNNPKQKNLLQKSALPMLTVYHELQQPKGSSPCVKTPCLLCLPTRDNPAGFTCTCPDTKLLMPDATCEYPRFAYATSSTINLLELKGGELIQTEVFSPDEDVVAFDVDWYRDWIYWANGTGQVKRISLTQPKTQTVATLKPACTVKVDQRTGNLYWVSCDHVCIGVTVIDRSYPRLLYRAGSEVIRDIYLDWLRGGLYWLEEGRILSMSLSGGSAKEVLNIGEGVTGGVALDLRANSLLWNNGKTGLSSMSLLQGRTHQARKGWNIPGTVMAAFEPFLVSLSNDVITLWDRQDGSRVQDVPVGRAVVGVIAALKDIKAVSTTPPVCNSPSVMCPQSVTCISKAQLCDGRKDCPDGFDEDLCVKKCPNKGDFKCKDRRSCVSRSLVCDGRSHCHDGSDEVGCPTIAVPTSQAAALKCRLGSKPCKDGRECVLFSHVCDGERDCQDGSDEEGCQQACRKGEFLCAHGQKCISIELVCDGKAQCQDRSDELDCWKPTEGCHHRCDNDKRCIPDTFLCDGERDCLDGSDEKECDSTTRAPVPNVRSLYKSPPPVQPPTQPPVLTTTQPSCYSPSVLCPGSSLCLPPTQLCDGRRDCPDGFDEEGCVRKCPNRADFRCKDRRSCVSRSLVCDGRSHCHDGSDEVGCPTIAAPTSQAAALKCRLGSKPCKDGRECVLFSHVCDRERDCQDGSDEEGCDAPETAPPPIAPVADAHISYKYSPPVPPSTPPPTQPACLSPSVRCPGSSLCISQTQLCDGQTDCPDGFDEQSCVKRCPYKTDFRCQDRRSCVSRSLVCDGRSHCHDGSDEVGCPTIAAPTSQAAALKCRLGSKPCKDGRECVLVSHVCDGERDCQDGSDEEGCDSPLETPVPPVAPAPDALHPPPCLSPSVRCPGSSMCISHTQLCDGQTDCPNGFDEQSCVKRCPYKTDFRCQDRRSCVSKSLVCDGRSHCHDGSDEVGCPTIAAPTSQAAALKCRLGSKPCKDGRECVLFSHVCDGERDCQDGSDEEGCKQACKEVEFQCAHGKKCIPQQQVCDGTPQCQDRSDELDCWKPTKSCQHRCDNNKRCVPATFLCDGERDCQDGTDERDCDPVTTDPDEQTTPPPAQPACLSPSVLCPGSSLCISQTLLCDGQTDCPDGFDEADCVDQCNNTADFLCRDRRKCIPRAQVCDGRSHCPDGSDERQCQSEAPPLAASCRLSCDQGSVCLTDKQLCDGRRDCKDRTDERLCSSDRAGRSRAVTPAPVKCRLGSKPCKDGRECVLYSHVCDGETDCQDGSDEEECASQCKSGEFQCAHGKKCIPQQQVCDGTAQCQDRSDELDCWKPTEGCRHRCDNATRCIPETFLCDGEEDCTDGSDEKTCGLEPCGTGQYRCASGQCVSEGLHCDGHADCRDHSDEAGCAKPPRCPPELRCPHSHECLLKEWFCDGEEDCQDGSDEGNCPVSPVKCGVYQWPCASRSQCIPLSWRCDGQMDCHDRSDEAGCGQSTCPPQLFQCGSGECVDPVLVCNRITNCADRSDEGPGCLQQNCSTSSAPRCDHHCISTPHGPRCGCASGFRLQASGVSCVDVDECKEMKPAVCKHACLNTRGSYLCRCYPGYLLEPDNRSCKTTDEPWLLASVQSELLLLGVRSASLRLLSSASRPVFSLDYHWEQHRVYWLSPDHQSIRWATTDNSRKQGTIVKGVKSDSIAVDWVGRNLYWVDGLAGQILAVPLGDTVVKPQNYSVVLDEDLEQPRSLVLLPHRGLMLWSEIGSSPQIERSGMDGSERKVVVSRGLSWPVSLTFDLLADRLYWTDEKLRCIGSASLDGEDIKLLQLAETPSPFSVAVFNDRVYWSDTKRRTIRSADKNTGKNQKVLLKRPGQPFGLRLMHALSQPAVSSPCDQLHCSHLCLLAPNPSPGVGGRAPGGQGLAAVCRCPAGLLLSGDALTCSPPVDTAFLLLLSPTTITQIYLRSMREGVGLKQWPDHRVLALPGVSEASGLDAALQGQSLYVADAGQGSVGLLKLGSSGSSQGLVPGGRILKLQDDLVTALAVDWLTTNFYWSSAKQPDIYVTSPHDGFTTSLLQGTLQSTTSIALHPPSGRLCFTTMGTVEERSQPQVDCSYMDGRNRAVLWRKANIPVSLVFSSKGTALYWADIGEGVISSIGLDGSGYKQYKAGPGLLVSFTRTENMLLWVTLDRDVTRLWFSDGFQPKQLWFEVKTNIVALRAYSKNSQKGSNSCSARNGECQQLCLAYPNGRTCKCGRDFHPVNVTSCAPSAQCPAGSKACWDGRCLPSTKFCDGHFDCLDRSDEQDCSYTNSASFGAKSKSSSSSLAAPVDSGPSIQRDSTSCDLQRCGGHGNCVAEGKVTRCQCMAGYTGEFCMEGEEPQGSHAPVVLSILCLIAGLVAAAVIIRKRRVWAAIRSRGIEKETLMTNMEERTVYSESFSNELYEPDDEEEQVSPADSSPKPPQ